MPRFVAMLRGINVGGNKRIAMPQLKEGFEQIGLQNAVTYVQSGNVIFDAEAGDNAELARSIQDIINKRFGHNVMVLIRTAEEMDTIVAGNPFLFRQGISPAKLHVTFLSAAPAPERPSTIRPDLGGEDQWSLQGSDIYLYCPNGYGRTKLTNALFEQKLGVGATTRNWNTVTALRDMANRGIT